MVDLVSGIIGLGIFALFAGFLALKLFSPPLMIITGFVLLLAIYDLIETLRHPEDNL
jgi:hypothetical protein